MSYQPYQTPNPGYQPYQQQMAPNKDRDHLKLLSIFYYILGGLNILGVCGSTIYVGLGVMMLAAPQGDADAEVAGVVFLLFGGFIFAISLAVTIMLFLTAQSLTQHSRYTLCFVTACFICLSVPFGTILGIFTIMVLLRPTVKPLFGKAAF